MKKTILTFIIAFISILSILGSGSSGDEPAEENKSWDSMVWDKDKWG